MHITDQQGFLLPCQSGDTVAAAVAAVALAAVAAFCWLAAGCCCCCYCYHCCCCCRCCWLLLLLLFAAGCVAAFCWLAAGCCCSCCCWLLLLLAAVAAGNQSERLDTHRGFPIHRRNHVRLSVPALVPLLLRATRLIYAHFAGCDFLLVRKAGCSIRQTGKVVVRNGYMIVCNCVCEVHVAVFEKLFSSV